MQEQAVSPSTLFKNASGHLFRQLELGTIVERAQQTFKEKTYLERYKNLYTSANVASFVLQTLSALFAFTFGQHLVAGVLPQLGDTFVLVASCFLAALLLLGIEVFKRLCLGSFVVTFIQSRATHSGISVSWAALAVNVCLIAVAVYTSTQGAKEFTKRQTDKSGFIQERYAHRADSATAAVQQQMEAEKKGLADFKQSVTWKGKINMSESNTAFTIASFNRRLENLQAEKEKALASLDTGLQTDLNHNATKTASDSGNMFWISLLVELAGLLCIGYVYFYLSRVFIESGLRQAAPPQTALPDQPESAPETAQNLVSPSPTDALLEPAPFQQPIGFRRYDAPQSSLTHKPLEGENAKVQILEKYHLNPVPHTPSGFTIADMQGFLEKYNNVVKCLEEGLSNKMTAKRCKVSQSTVHNVKRCLRNLGNATISAD